MYLLCELICLHNRFIHLLWESIVLTLRIDDLFHFTLILQVVSLTWFFCQAYQSNITKCLFVSSLNQCLWFFEWMYVCSIFIHPFKFFFNLFINYFVFACTIFSSFFFAGRFIDLLRELINETEHLQNNPPKVLCVWSVNVLKSCLFFIFIDIVVFCLLLS
jgi:hypothetical protein